VVLRGGGFVVEVGGGGWWLKPEGAGGFRG
jgi:hypothetical protein